MIPYDLQQPPDFLKKTWLSAQLFMLRLNIKEKVSYWSWD
jgi:hypothetical protein